jgi:hypothetical protein
LVARRRLRWHGRRRRSNGRGRRWRRGLCPGRQGFKADKRKAGKRKAGKRKAGKRQGDNGEPQGKIHELPPVDPWLTRTGQVSAYTSPSSASKAESLDLSRKL